MSIVLLCWHSVLYLGIFPECSVSLDTAFCFVSWYLWIPGMFCLAVASVTSTFGVLDSPQSQCRTAFAIACVAFIASCSFVLVAVVAARPFLNFLISSTCLCAVASEHNAGASWPLRPFRSPAHSPHSSPPWHLTRPSSIW